MTVTLPPGSTLKETYAAAEQARELVQKNQHVKLVYTAIGGGAAGSDPFAGGGVPEVRKAVLTINMTHRNDRPGLSKQDLEAQLRDALAVLPGARVKVGLGASSEKYVLVLAGEDGRVARPSMPPRSSASCAPSPASARSPPPPAWCGPS